MTDRTAPGVLSRARALLTSDEAIQVLLAALVGSDGAPPADFAATLTDLHARAGTDVTGIFRVSYRPDPADAAVVTDFLAVTTAQTPDAPIATVTRDGLALQVWRHPADPRLADLPAACDPATVAGWIGVPVRALTTTSYRPLRRAVLRASTSDGNYYIKVAPPKRAAAIAARQRMLADAGIAPGLVGTPLPGVLVSEAAEGLPLAEHLSALRPELAVPTARSLIDLLDAIPAQATDLPRRPSWSERLDYHVSATRDAIGDSPLLRGVAEDLSRLIAHRPAGPVVATHGDCYEANVFVAGGRPAMLIDTDSVGPGHRVDDLACLLAHLAVLPSLSAQHYPGVPRVIEDWRAVFESQADPAALRARIAGVILSLVPGAARGLGPDWLSLAADWRDCALAAT